MSENKSTPPLELYCQQVQLLRKLAWQEAQRAQRVATRLTLLTSYLDLLLREMRAPIAAEESPPGRAAARERVS